MELQLWMRFTGQYFLIICKEVSRALDILIKNNIIKKNKMIIDIGLFATKILEVHYASKKVTVTHTAVFDNKSIDDVSEMNFDEIAKKVNEETTGTGKKDVSISIPAELCENKIITIKNKRESEIPKIIKKEYMTFGKVNPITHVVDYAFLGKREEQGDSVYYYLISAIQKTVSNDLINAFLNHKMKVKNIVSSVYTQICLSELFFDEYEHLNRLMIDFGTNTSRVTAFSEGIAVYTRVLDFGFESYVGRLFNLQDTAGKPDIIKTLLNVGEKNNTYEYELREYFELLDFEVYSKCVGEIDETVFRDISRVIDLCSNNDVSISKIYCTGFTLLGFPEKLKDMLNIEVENVFFRPFDKKEGKDYVIEIGDVRINGEYSNAIGLSICPML